MLSGYSIRNEYGVSNELEWNFILLTPGLSITLNWSKSQSWVQIDLGRGLEWNVTKILLAYSTTYIPVSYPIFHDTFTFDDRIGSEI